MPRKTKSAKTAKEGEESNKSSSPSYDKTKEYTFYAGTLFYEDESAKNAIIDKCKSVCKEIWIGFETCPTTGKPHMQSFLSLRKKARPTALWKLFPKQGKLEPTYSGQLANISYCTKDNNYIHWRLEDDKPPAPEIPDECLHNTWNEWIINEIQQPADKRTIHWFWSSKGKTGKTSLVRLLVNKYNAQFATGGKYTDIMNLVYHTDMNKCNCVIFLLPKEHKNHISYSALESVKDGLVSNMKSFKNGSKVFPRPHLFVFANYPPDTENLSGDRWNIIQLDYMHSLVKKV